MIPFFKNNRFIILVLMVALGLFGLKSLFSITKEAVPSVNVPYYSVTTIYPGADPKTIDDQITEKLVKKLKGISGIKNINASSATNISLIVIEFQASKNANDATNDIKAAIDQITPTLPTDAKTPIAKQIDMMMMPVYQFTVGGPYSSEILLKKTQELEKSLKALPGVADIMISGKPTQEIKVNVDLNTIQAMGLDFSYIISQLRGLFVKYPADKKEIGGTLYSFEISTYEANITDIIEQIKNTDILAMSGRTIKISDIANVYSSYTENPQKIFIVSGDTTTNSLGFFVTKSAGADLQDITLALKGKVDAFRKDNPDLQTLEIQSSEEIINMTYNLFLENFWETGLFVMLVVVVFLGFKSSIVVLISFLLVYLINFLFLDKAGYTFNNIVSFSLILVLGIMVDNLIVITQGITIGLREKKGKIREAIKFALHHYGSAVFFGTFCTIVIFVPLLFNLTGIIGEFMKAFPIVIVSNLGISLIISLIGLPVLYSYFFRRDHHAHQETIETDTHSTSHHDKQEFQIPKSLQLLERRGVRFGNLFYRRNEKKSTAKRTLAIFWIIFFVAIALIPLGLIKMDFLGTMDQSNIWVNIKYKPGISTQENMKNTNIVLQDVMQFMNQKYGKDIKYTTVEIGSVNGERSMGGTDKSHFASITFKLYNKPTKGIGYLLGLHKIFGNKEYERQTSSYIIVDDLQQFLTSSIKPKYSFLEEIAPVQVKGGPPSGKAIGFYILGNNLDTVGTYYAKILPEIQKIPGLFNVSSSVEYSNGRIEYSLDTNKIKEYSINPLSVMTLLAGVKNSAYSPNGILIKEFGDLANDPIKLNAYVLYSGNFDDITIGQIPLKNIIHTVRLQPELLSVDRFGDQQSIKIEADKKPEVALSDVTKQIDTILKNNPLPDGVTYKSAGDAEFQDTSGRDLGISIVIGILLMYLVLVILFKNFRYPTAIITSIFLSIAGALILLALTGMTFNFPAQLGIFGVLGVGVNQAIIHIQDFKVFYENQGMSVIDSFRKSIALRFVPIFLTKLTTILGLIILALKDEIYGGMAVSFIGGLLMSFLITLLYLPTLIRVFSKEKRKKMDDYNLI